MIRYDTILYEFTICFINLFINYLNPEYFSGRQPRFSANELQDP